MEGLEGSGTSDRPTAVISDTVPAHDVPCGARSVDAAPTGAVTFWILYIDATFTVTDTLSPTSDSAEGRQSAA